MEETKKTEQATEAEALAVAAALLARYETAFLELAK